MIINKFTIDSFYLQRPVRVTMAMPYPIMDKNITVIWALHCSLKDENFFFDYLGIGRFVDLKKSSLCHHLLMNHGVVRMGA